MQVGKPSFYVDGEPFSVRESKEKWSAWISEDLSSYLIREFAAPFELVSRHDSLLSDLNIDDLSRGDLFEWAAKKYHIKYDPEEIKQLETLADLYMYIMDKLNCIPKPSPINLAQFLDPVESVVQKSN